MSKSLRGQSREEFTTDSKTLEDLKTGAILRIADACEKMCINRERLERELKSARDYIGELRDVRDSRNKTISSLRGQITKLKKRIAELEAQAVEHGQTLGME